VLADDGEKFGGWPGTKEWVYGSGWMADFTATLQRLADDGIARLATFAEIVEEVPSGGLAYLPSASYREMEGWALPAGQAVRLKHLEDFLGEARISGKDGALIRGSHWRHFLAKYPESNRMHKKMLVLSRLCRERGDPAGARRAVGQAQCNDAYWHGVFGGLYLPHLRDGIWRALAQAEQTLRAGEGLAIEPIDLDCDGHREWWVHSATFSALIAPHRGAAIEEWTSFASLRNAANVLTRRHEGYHQEAVERERQRRSEPEANSAGAPSIHHLEESLRLAQLPPADRWPRAIGLESIVGPVEAVADWVAGAIPRLRDWGGANGGSTAGLEAGVAVIRTQFDGLRKTIRIDDRGRLRVEFEWDALPGATWFTTEWSLAHEVTIRTDATARWGYPIETIAKSERGFDRTIQGQALVLGWSIGSGRGFVEAENPTPPATEPADPSVPGE